MIALNTNIRVKSNILLDKLVTTTYQDKTIKIPSLISMIAV